ncbi:hypothetical protein NL676_007251 [Syzygium grande]|nr:hypothetical protein NL676_007251 [Syzygium grande]
MPLALLEHPAAAADGLRRHHVANFVDVPQVADLLCLFSRSNSTSAGTNISFSKELLLITEEEIKIASLQPAWRDRVG